MISSEGGDKLRNKHAVELANGLATRRSQAFRRA
jgi:hypothetical protein